MNKVSLANKYRPQDFDSIVEQDAVKTVLKNQIKTNNLKHAYLFCGGAGTGKTTTCRIIANEMNNGKGEVIELDCASHNGVDDMKVIQDQCKTRSLVGKYKIFILDECFTGDTLIMTDKGQVPIKDIKVGDIVATSSGYHFVKKCHKNLINDSKIIKLILSNGKCIITTKDHLFMTTQGWIHAKDLKNHNIISFNDMSNIWKTSSNNVSEKYNILLEGTDNTTIVTTQPQLQYVQNYGMLQNVYYEKYYIDILKHTTDSMLIVNDIQNLDVQLEMYDLTVDTDCTYFANGVLVHNCHMLTVQAWNSMLKLIEEPPSYIIMMFATTDPQKIPSTILSRLQRFNFTRISVPGIVNRLKYIIDSENKENPDNIIHYEESAITYIARICKGGMRDSITTLEKCLDYDRNLTLDNVLKITSGGVSEITLLHLMQSILQKDVKLALNIFDAIYMSGTDTSLFLKLYVEFVENCVKFIITNNASTVTLTDITISYLISNSKSIYDKLKIHLRNTMTVKGYYATDDLKILIESWLVQECS